MEIAPLSMVVLGVMSFGFVGCFDVKGGVSSAHDSDLDEPDGLAAQEPSRSAASAAVSYQYGERFGGNGFSASDNPSLARQPRIAVDGAGNAVIAGEFDGVVDFGGGPLHSAGNKDVYVAKFDASGDLLWSKRFGDGEMQRLTGLSVDAKGNVVISGVFEGKVDFGGGVLPRVGIDIFVARFDPAGNHLWSRSFGGQDNMQWSYGVACDGAGSVLLAGNLEGMIDFGGITLTSHALHAFVAKLDTLGHPVWAQAFGGSVDQEVSAIAADKEGNVFVAGNHEGISIGGQKVDGHGLMDLFVAKLGPGGELRWLHGYGDDNDSWADSLAVDRDGGVVVTGRFNGKLDFGAVPPISPPDAYDYRSFAVRLDAGGKARWARQFAATGALAASSGSEAYLAGNFSGSLDLGGSTLQSAAGKDIFVARFAPSGDVVWSARYGGPKDQTATGVTVDGSGAVLLTGLFAGALGFGPDNLSSQSGQDVFLAKLSP